MLSIAVQLAAAQDLLHKQLLVHKSIGLASEQVWVYLDCGCCAKATIMGMTNSVQDALFCVKHTNYGLQCMDLQVYYTILT